MVRVTVSRILVAVSLVWNMVALVRGSVNTLEHRTLFHLFPSTLQSPLHSATSALGALVGGTNIPSHELDTHNHHSSARASSTVSVLSFTRKFDGTREDDIPPTILLPNDVTMQIVAGEWRTNEQLNRLVQLQCGVVLLEYCADVNEDEPKDWSHMQLDHPCIIPLVQLPATATTETDQESVYQIDGVSVIVLLPSSASTIHPSLDHHASGNVNHHGLPAGSSSFWNTQCQLTLSNEFELDTPDEKHAMWLDQHSQPSEEVRFFSDFPSAEGSGDTDSSSLWSTPSASASSTAFLTEFFRQHQLKRSGRLPLENREYEDLFGEKSPQTNESSSSDFSSFLETEAVVDVTDASSVLSELHAREMADTNDMYRLMGQLTDATRTGASATVVWELVIRPCVNILRKVLLQALKVLMAKTLIKGLHNLVTSTINPHSPPPDESEYTKPPVWEVENPEELWSSLKAEVPEAIVPPPEMGTELAQVQVTDAIFLSVEHVVGTQGILDPMLAFLVPVLHNTVTQATHDIAQKGMDKSIHMHSIAPMKEQIHSGVHRKTVEMLISQLVEQLTDHVTKHLIAQLPRTLTILCTQDVHKALSRPLTFQLAYGLTFSLTRSRLQDEECQTCESDQTKCSACEVTKANDMYVNYYTDYYAKYFEKYYTFYYTEYYGKLFANDQLKKGGGGGGGGGGEEGGEGGGDGGGGGEE